MIFRGRYEYTIDPKGRVNIPSRFRDQLSETGKETVVITNYEHCIYAYPAEEWERIEEKLAAKVSSVNRKENAFVRFVVGGGAWRCAPPWCCGGGQPPPPRFFPGSGGSPAPRRGGGFPGRGRGPRGGM